MNKYSDIEQIMDNYLKSIFSFALKRTRTIQEAEDLSQEIMIKVYKSLTNAENIYDIDKYVWRIAHNTLANYYRSKSKESIGVNLDDIIETLKCDRKNPEEAYLKNEQINKLRDKIAYLSKLQREIVILYYYQGKKQDEISQLLNIPKGTIKWHLFEAKKELKEGMENMDNKVYELKFNPIKFDNMGVNGCIGKEGGTSKFFKSALAQNIAYSVYREEKTVNEIANILGVSPVYIESEVEYLEEYGFLINLPGNKYISNLIIEEITQDMLELVDNMYKNLSKLIANEIYDEVINSGLIDNENIYYPDNDKNFLMWTIVLYIISQSNSIEDRKIKFEEVATIRKDGGCYIASASVENKYIEKPKISKHIEGWCGPIWNFNNGAKLWQINSKWSTREINFDMYSELIQPDIKLLSRYVEKDSLSSEEFIYLAQKGYIQGSRGKDKLNIVWLKNDDIREKLLYIGNNVFKKYKNEINEIKSEYIKQSLKNTPKHLRKVREYENQDLCNCNGTFLLYSLVELLNTNRIYEISDENKKKVLKTLLLTNL